MKKETSVFARVQTDVLEAFRMKCKLNGLKQQFVINDLLKKFSMN
jgi:predicted DNA binding CopG/RHH family protein